MDVNVCGCVVNGDLSVTGCRHCGWIIVLIAKYEIIRETIYDHPSFRCDGEVGSDRTFIHHTHSPESPYPYLYPSTTTSTSRYLHTILYTLTGPSQQHRVASRRLDTHSLTHSTSLHSTPPDSFHFCTRQLLLFIDIQRPRIL